MDPDDTGWHLMLRDDWLFEGREETFKRILWERGLKWKPEEFLGWTHISIYKLGYKFKGWKSNGYKPMSACYPYFYPSFGYFGVYFQIYGDNAT